MAPARLGLGHLARGRGDHAAALAEFAAAAAAAPRDPWPRIEAATSLRQLRRFAEAEAECAAALELRPGEVQALLGLGHAARGRGDLAGALRHYRAAVAAGGPRNPWPRLELAMALRALDRP
ncbi:tetratricopeptide repeat protein, partial [Paracraurococcus ruber]